jgi:hypothetical protein
VTQDSALTSALQAALAAEDAAIFGYGVAGAYLAGARQSTARACWDEHKSARDTVTAMLAARGARPVAAQAAYRLPFDVRTAARAVALALYLEDGVTTAYLGVVAAGGPAARQFGALAMQQCAVRAAHWRGATVAFPGIPAGGPRPGPGPQPPERSRSTPPAA